MVCFFLAIFFSLHFFFFQFRTVNQTPSFNNHSNRGIHLLEKQMSKVLLIRKPYTGSLSKIRAIPAHSVVLRCNEARYFSTNHGSLLSQISSTPAYLEYITRSANKESPNERTHKKPKFIIEQYLTDKFTKEIVTLVKLGKLQDIVDRAERLTPELIIYVIEKSMADCPPMPSNATNVEVPYFISHKQLRFQNPYYKFINSKVPYLYDMVKRASPAPVLYPYYIWLYYHMNDTEGIAKLSTVISRMNSRTIVYFLSSFIHNYELETFKKYFHTIIINSSKNLPSSLLDGLIPQLIGHNIVFENLFFVFQLWMNSPKCEAPSAESISLILLEFYRFGTAHEIKEFKRLIKKYNNHYLIKTIDYQFEIINREYLSFKKNITQEDLDIIASMQPQDRDVEFYYRWLYFMIRYSNMDSINFVLKLYKDSASNVQLPSRFFKVLLDYYEKHDKFIPLLQLLEASKESISYDPSYLSTIVKTFIYSYSRFAPQFVSRLNEWLGEPYFNLTQLSSQFYPYHLHSRINKWKYKEPEWQEVKFSPNRDENYYQSQVDFRVQHGFRNLLARGVRPDFKMALDTFRFGNLDDRLYIKSLLIQTRQYNHKNQKTLELRSLKHPSLEKEDLLRYFETNKDQLNDSHKFYFVRMLMDYDLLEEAKFLIDSIDDSYLNDKNKMFKIILELRMCMMANDFESMAEVLTRFKLHDDQLYISPYLLNQTLNIENALYNKLRKNQQTMDQEMLISGKDCLMKLRLFIGDVKLLLEKDEQEMTQLIDKTISILNQWKENGK
ncbi:predicted protein [Candida tropicalis MYA-3404]|uniref:ATPase expression protein 2, mitochondrial n=1 Tax=Candida tropicalis (strain ATCC MYA-3404 / T1) TaxID=294747 RepID=C5MAA9_CANTT|nr:predicted protein [Candida tropicalis MYA-3404]EER33603.1 predicted protein [Candida tropicalis MYA-3404]KAG4407445.1 hypothetical protein JTP64_002980 [Candida tropicalis]